MNISINPIKTTQTLSFIALVLVVLHLAACVPHFFYGRSYPFSPFNLDSEQNIPTLFATLLFIFVALLALNIARLYTHTSFSTAIRWIGIAILFFFLGIDEFTEIHERIDFSIRSSLNTSGLFYFSWVLPYLSVMILLIICNIRFIRSLPKKTIQLLLLSFFLYVGAFAIEMLSGSWFEINGKTPIFYLFVTVEELLEMLGTITVIHALIAYADLQAE